VVLPVTRFAKPFIEWLPPSPPVVPNDAGDPGGCPCGPGLDPAPPKTV